ncbi:hypothetical protein BZG36_04541, partial [Bifiguratus adelaidae]
MLRHGLKGVKPWVVQRRLASTAPSSSSYTPYVRFRNVVLGTATVLGATFLTSYYLDSRSAAHQYVVMPLIHATMDPESAHKLAVWSLKWKLAAKDRGTDDPVLETEIFGKRLSNPIGVAAGFDKHGEAIDGLFDLGFGYVEIGSVTPEPQPGNSKPRMFRLPEDVAVINRYGFNSEGHDSIAKLNGATADQTLLDNLSPDGNRSLYEGHILGINLGKNKTTTEEDAYKDYVLGVQRFAPYADALVINISSPNTPGLRALQRREVLQGLLSKVVNARNEICKANRKVPLLVKIAPDLTEHEVQDIAMAVKDSGIDGVIVSNTTIDRPLDLKSNPLTIQEAGGLSGPPLKAKALKTLKTLRQYTGGAVPLIGCGGITTADDVLDFARAGASAVQLYTAFAFQGVGIARNLKDEVTEKLKKEGKT